MEMFKDINKTIRYDNFLNDKIIVSISNGYLSFEANFDIKDINMNDRRIILMKDEFKNIKFDVHSNILYIVFNTDISEYNQLKFKEKYIEILNKFINIFLFNKDTIFSFELYYEGVTTYGKDKLINFLN
jgi:hypothetical protein